MMAVKNSPHHNGQDLAETHNDGNEQQRAPASAQPILAEKDPVRSALIRLLFRDGNLAGRTYRKVVWHRWFLRCIPVRVGQLRRFHRFRNQRLAISPVQSSTTLPVWPERIAVKPCSKSA